MRASPLFEFEHVTVRFDELTAVDDLTCAIPESGVTVLVGPSGSGKSTLLRLCNRLEVPTSGIVRFRGTPLDDLDPLQHRRRVGMVLQAPTPFAGTVRDNLVVAQPEASTEEMTRALEDAGLEATFLGRDAQELSGGEGQRVCVARTLITRPEVLLLDEPTGALDIDHRVAFERRMRTLADAGTPIVWVTHDLEQAHRVGDHWIALVDGRLGTEDEARHYMEQASEVEEGALDGRD